jgi:putative membrane protein
MTSIKSQFSVNAKKPAKFYFRLSLSVFIYVIPEVLACLTWSLIITLIHQFVHKVDIDTILISIILGVISFLLVFRTNTAYDKYLEACKLWAEVENSTLGLTSLSLVIWSSQSDLPVKNYIVALLKTYCQSIRDYLRDENRNDFSFNAGDVIGSLLTIDGVGDNSDEFKCKHNFPQDRVNNHNHHSRLGVQSVFGTGKSHLDESIRSYVMQEQGGDLKNFDIPVRPLEVAYQLNRVFMKQVAIKNISNPVHGQLITWTNNLSSAAIQLNRIKTMPIPKAYTAHLYQSLIIFHILLPFQTLKVVYPLPYLTMLISVVTSYVLFGTLAIGERIEDPLGTDSVDLPLDEYCNFIRIRVDNLLALDSRYKRE